MAAQKAALEATMEHSAHAAAATHKATVSGGAGTTAAVTAAFAAAGAGFLSVVPPGVLTELLTSGISVSIANTATNPLDVVKVRLQMEQSKVAVAGAGAGPRLGMLQTGAAVVRNEGVTALWSGLGPSLARGFFFGGARLGMYTPIKSALVGEGKQTFATKILAGTLSGGFAAAATSPIELVKTRLQAAGASSATGTAGAAPRSSMGVIRAVIAADGVVGLWKGAMPGLVRSSILTAAQCATYDEIKKTVRTYTGLHDGVTLHLSSSLLAGLITTTITNPVDVVKTRMFMGGSRYTGALQCASSIFKSDGAMGFMKGWSASYARLGPHTVIMFLTAEQLRRMAGLQSL
ncbi:hypothetical protein FOA52_010604 [Chlamydomonas sp. UWO 241]|nr:hypothetical protein FOA52_010604 [Chlamydomonas sp. UWO 241]